MAEIEAKTIPTPPEVIKQQIEWETGTYQREYDAVTVARQQGYQSTSDPIFMQYQRGEATKEEWLAAVEKVKTDNPYPEVAN